MANEPTRPNENFSAVSATGMTVADPTTKFQRVLTAAREQFDGVGPDPEIIGAIAIHESGFSGPVGFGILGSRGYRVDADVAAAVADFTALVSSGRYERAWAVRGDSEAFLNALCDAGYAGPEGRAWVPKIIWLRDWMMANPGWRSD